jgi:S1-C subfamily serine protease
MVLPSVVRISVDTGFTQSSGTGIVFDNTGKILTNWHVVEDALTIRVTRPDETIVLAELYRGDPENDIALVVVQDPTGLKPALFGDSGGLAVGDDVVAIGHAFGLPGPPTVSRGIVSALGRTLPNGVGGDITGLIQTDAAINSGNSGGPLINGRGEVIAMNTAKLSVGDRIGFAININSSLDTANELVVLGPIPPPGFLGTTGRTMSRIEAAILGLPVGGYLVLTVGADGPAFNAEVLIDDVIVQMDLIPIRGSTDYAQFLKSHPEGDVVRIFIWRLIPGSGWEPIITDAVLSARA